MNRSITFILITLLFCQAQLGYASRADFKKEREVYQQALLKLQHKGVENTKRYQQLRQQLENYPLKGYLDYAELKRRFSQLPRDDVRAFQQRYKGEYISHRLTLAWLNYLGRHRHWQDYQAFYQPEFSSDSRACYKLRADLAGGVDRNEVMNQVSQLWQKPYSMPDACDPLFHTWRKAGFQTATISWKRFEASYAKNNLSLARYLTRFLNKEDKALAKRLLSPEQHANSWLTELASPMPKHVLQPETIKRLLTKLSASHFQEIAELLTLYQLPLNNDDELALKRLVAWYMAKESPARAEHWLSQQQQEDTPSLAEARIRYALQDRNWKDYLKAYNVLNEDQQQDPEWLFWYAQAQQETKQFDSRNPTHKILRTLAKQRNYYGFLAAEKLSTLPAIYTAHAEVPETLSAEIKQQLAAAMELYYLGQMAEADTEWWYATQAFDATAWQQAAELARRNGWHARAIAALAKAKLWHHVDARFPLAYAKEFNKYADKQGIQPSWLMAMARQESGFSARAKSHRGALGVLQLMPQTAKNLARRLKLHFSKEKLLEPAYNIRLGSNYMKKLLARFDNNYILATAAYNAGPHRVKEWLSLRPMTDDWAHWVATIPYKETREYVQNILAYSTIYQNRLNKQNFTLSLSLLTQNDSAIQ